MEALELYKEESAKVKAHQELCHKKEKQVLQTRTMYSLHMTFPRIQFSLSIPILFRLKILMPYFFYKVAHLLQLLKKRLSFQIKKSCTIHFVVVWYILSSALNKPCFELDFFLWTAASPIAESLIDGLQVWYTWEIYAGNVKESQIQVRELW